MTDWLNNNNKWMLEAFHHLPLSSADGFCKPLSDPDHISAKLSLKWCGSVEKKSFILIWCLHYLAWVTSLHKFSWLRLPDFKSLNLPISLLLKLIHFLLSGLLNLPDLATMPLNNYHAALHRTCHLHYPSLHWFEDFSGSEQPFLG